MGRRRSFLALGGSVLILSACSTPSTTTKTLKVATEPAFPPFEAKGATDLEGFDIDLMRAIGKAAGLTVEFESLPFDGIIPGLQAGTVDGAISAITINAERAKTISFSRPYFKAGLAIVIADTNTTINTLEDLKDKKIAVQIGTTGAGTAKTVAGAEVRIFDSAPLALQELLNGNVDAVINDAPATLYAIKSGNLKGLKITQSLVTEEFYGIALPKDSPNLEAINSALNQLITEGTYAEIYKKWFDGEPPVLPEKAPLI